MVEKYQTNEAALRKRLSDLEETNTRLQEESNQVKHMLQVFQQVSLLPPNGAVVHSVGITCLTPAFVIFESWQTIQVLSGWPAAERSLSSASEDAKAACLKVLLLL